MEKRNEIMLAMIDYYRGDPKRIQHFTKVQSYAKLIGEREGLAVEKQYGLELAAFVHDIGIKIAEEKYGTCTGKLQEQEGPAEAEMMLRSLGVDEETVQRVSYLVSKHHTYKDIDGLDYQILVEADFLVNMYEDGLSEASIQAAYNNIFVTESGKELCRRMYETIKEQP